MDNFNKSHLFGLLKTSVVAVMLYCFHQAFQPYEDVISSIQLPFTLPQHPMVGIVGVGLTFLAPRSNKIVELILRAIQIAGIWWTKTILMNPIFLLSPNNPAIETEKRYFESIGFSILCGLTLFEFGMRTPKNIQQSPTTFGFRLNLITTVMLVLLTILTEDSRRVCISLFFLTTCFMFGYLLLEICKSRSASDYTKLQVHQTAISINIFITVIIPTFYNFPNQHYLYATTLLIYALARISAKLGLRSLWFIFALIIHALNSLIVLKRRVKVIIFVGSIILHVLYYSLYGFIALSVLSVFMLLVTSTFSQR